LVAVEVEQVALDLEEEPPAATAVQVW